MQWLKNLLGDNNNRLIKQYKKRVLEINALEPQIEKMTQADMRSRTAFFMQTLSQANLDTKENIQKALDPILSEAFALVREAARRTLGQRHFDVQLIGGMIMNDGNIAEMRTGEGKTLVATLPGYLNALTGKGVHVVTVNDYLSRRDGVWMGQIYDYLGLTVGILNHDSSFIYDPSHTGEQQDDVRDEQGSFKVVNEFMRPVSRGEAYKAHITYGTNSEFGFDYLRDNLEYRSERLRQRLPNYAIVDEIDSILIDEARTPLIISAPAADSGMLYAQFAQIAASLNLTEDYTVDEKSKSVAVTMAGIAKVEKAMGVQNLYADAGIKYVHHLETALKAKSLYTIDTDYVVKDGQVVIVDPFTGRMQPGRRWSEGLHQAVEAKEGLKVQQESRTFASITYQNFFRLYTKLSGMTGTAETSKEEFYKVYGLDTVVVPTNKTVARKDHQDVIFRTEQGKFKAIARRVKEIHSKGQPVLIGTVSIERHEMLSKFLEKEGVPHNMLNAKNHEKEGEIVAQAGKKGAVTIATNMAGRGVDIKLGGNLATPEWYEEVKALGGLFVLGTERHDARRRDNQLRGRAGRQGDPGETQFFVSLEDSLMRIFGGETIRGVLAKLNVPEDEAIQNSFITRTLEGAQSKIEGFHFDGRKHVLQYDDVLNQQRVTVYARRRDMLTANTQTVYERINEIIARVPNTEDQEKLTKTVAEKVTQFGSEPFGEVIRQVILQSIDTLWVDHLEVMDYLRGSVNLRAYGQHDPLVEYKKEGLRLFKVMQMSVDNQILSLLPHVGVQVAQPAQEQLKEVHTNPDSLATNSGDQPEKQGNRKDRRAQKKNK